MQEADEEITGLACKMRNSATAIISWSAAATITLAKSEPDIGCVNDILRKIVECCHQMASYTDEPTR